MKLGNLNHLMIVQNIIHDLCDNRESDQVLLLLLFLFSN